MAPIDRSIQSRGSKYASFDVVDDAVSKGKQPYNRALLALVAGAATACTCVLVVPIFNSRHHPPTSRMYVPIASDRAQTIPPRKIGLSKVPLREAIFDSSNLPPIGSFRPRDNSVTYSVPPNQGVAHGFPEGSQVSSHVGKYLSSMAVALVAAATLLYLHYRHRKAQVPLLSQVGASLHGSANPWQMLATRGQANGASPKQTKFVVVVGGVCSSLGKGITCASLGALMKASGYRVTAIKMDPYMNTNIGSMNPNEQGEVFVLDDGGEAHPDLGLYERTMDLHLRRENHITLGKIYEQVNEAERRGKYMGRTMQQIPHVSGAIVDWLLDAGSKPTDGTHETPQICICELGGTVGDIDCMLFLEAVRELRDRVGRDNFCLIQQTLVPICNGTQKTKPTQHTVKNLMCLGLQPEVIVCRCDKVITDLTREKISLSCGVPIQGVIDSHTVSNMLSVPGMLADGAVINLLTANLRLDHLPKVTKENARANTGLFTLEDWERLARRKDEVWEEVVIAIVAKYEGDAYQSALQALDHAAVQTNRKLKVLWVDSADLEQPENSLTYRTAINKLASSDGIFVPGGFGDRGVKGKAAAANWARHHKIPFLGVSLGMQMAIVGFCQDELGLDGCTSEEFDPEGQQTHVLHYMPQVDRISDLLENRQNSMIIGARKIVLQSGSVASQLYGGLTQVIERQRHRYEVNAKWIPMMEKAGLVFSGTDAEGVRMEVVELSPDLGHPFFLGMQCHPEFKSRPDYPSPPFYGLLLAATKQLESGLKECLQKGPINHYRASHISGQ